MNSWIISHRSKGLKATYSSSGQIGYYGTRSSSKVIFTNFKQKPYSSFAKSTKSQIIHLAQSCTGDVVLFLSAFEGRPPLGHANSSQFV